MMKTLYLLRHAKSSWDDARLADHARPLAPRGQIAARRIADHLRQGRIQIDLALCSSAVRARQTLDIVAPALGETCQVRIEDELYAADAMGLLQRLRRVDDAVGSALLVGHNPALWDLAVSLAADGAEVPLLRMREKFPTGGLAEVTADRSWGEWDGGVAFLTSFVVPRELADG
jgi:phosphohistidine phosphatase